MTTSVAKKLRTTRPENVVQAETVRASVNAVTNLLGSGALTASKVLNVDDVFVASAASLVLDFQ